MRDEKVACLEISLDVKMLKELVILVFNFLSHDSKKEKCNRGGIDRYTTVEPKKALICILVYSCELHVQIYTQLYTQINTEVKRNPKLRGRKTIKSAV